MALVKIHFSVPLRVPTPMPTHTFRCIGELSAMPGSMEADCGCTAEIEWQYVAGRAKPVVGIVRTVRACEVHGVGLPDPLLIERFKKTLQELLAQYGEAPPF